MPVESKMCKTLVFLYLEFFENYKLQKNHNHHHQQTWSMLPKDPKDTLGYSSDPRILAGILVFSQFLTKNTINYFKTHLFHIKADIHLSQN